MASSSVGNAKEFLKVKASEAYGFATDKTGQAMDKVSDMAGKAKGGANDVYRYNI
ncbi:hypothetical protein P3L10_013836 [Capsicum annuum]